MRGRAGRGRSSHRRCWRHNRLAEPAPFPPACAHAGSTLLRPARSLRLAAQDVALSRRKQGFESPRERQKNQELSGKSGCPVQRMSNNAGWTIMDWIDPETWKLPAALVEYWKTVLVGAVAIVGAVGTILRWGLKPIRWAWSKMVEKVRRRPAAESGSQTTAETRPLRFVQEERRCFWTRAQKRTSE